jgi:23S rRNA (uracil1939-C5)-methyltransferase
MNEELILTIEKLVYGGDGLGHADGNTVFVPFVVPGERVRARVKAQKKKVVWADLVEVNSPAAARRAPPCPHFGKCGGCHYQHISHEEQVRQKQEILRETLARLGGIRWEGAIETHTAAPHGYRNRAQWGVREAKPRAIGYYLPESSVLLPIDECFLLSPRLAETFRQLQEMTRAGELPPGVREIEAFADSADDKIALNVAFHKFPKPAAELQRAFREALPKLESLLLLDQKTDRFDLGGPGYLFHEAGGFRYRVSHLSFFQVNRFLMEELLKTVVGGARGGVAFDLYAGVGFFTLPLGKAFARVVAVDANLAATRDLFANAEQAGIALTSFNDHTEVFLKKTEEKPDFVVVDPPRSGLGAQAAATLRTLGAPEIAYLSCDPATLARDLAVLTGSAQKDAAPRAGAPRYEISELHFFDLFPETFHIEVLAKLRRAS